MSVDSSFCHAAWAEQLGGVSLPLISDFHPKGEIAESFGTYLAAAGLCDRATVLIDAGGTVRYAASVTPAGKRDIEALVAECEALDAAWAAELPASAAPPGLAEGAVLFVKDRCMFSRWALYARQNLHLDNVLPVRNVSRDAEALAELERRGGKTSAPALGIGDEVMYESADIARYLVERCSPRWPSV